eukprot:TRINITY_DN9696_c0_g1_i1.p1 TRINITY_DN9696_c0_g1~~TRINITY_DN9696_c0_g1_i1.p1  ORF type:complete len:461 (-),score=109.08 TRINITY_DN9696_c0_g1_i1:204-1397(-)
MTLKLPFNVSDDPYMAAQQFIHKHDLSQYYLEEIANHIIKNTNGQVLGLGAGGNGDPFTGGSSYTTGGVSSGSSAPASGGMAVDPFTGSGAYTSGSDGSDLPRLGAQPPPDPWMAGAYRTDNENGMDVDKSNPYFPQRDFLRFDQPLKAEALVTKLKEFNAQCEDSLKLEDTSLEKLPDLALKEDNDPAGMEHLLKVLKWKDEMVFPGLDLVRLVLLHPHNQQHALSKDFLDHLFSVCLKHVNKESAVANQMLSLRILANLFSTSKGEELLSLYRESVITRIFENLFPVVKNNKHIQVAAATVMLNYAVSLANNPTESEEGQVQALSVLGVNFITFISDWEARFRAMVAIGTILSISRDNVEYGKTLDLKEGVRGWKVLEGPDKCTAVAQHIVNIME